MWSNVDADGKVVRVGVYQRQLRMSGRAPAEHAFGEVDADARRGRTAASRSPWPQPISSTDSPAGIRA